MASLATLGLRLVRAGGRGRWITIVVGTALATVLVMVAFAVPAAVREPGVSTTSAQRLEQYQLALLFALPVLALLFTVLRLSSSTRDRRLASLRLLGLNAASTRAVAAVEGGATALTGAAVGAALYVLVAVGTDAWGWGQPWLQQPLQRSLTAVLAPAGAIVAIAVVVALAPTRRLALDPRGARSEAAPATPSLWRLVPFVTALGVLAWLGFGEHGHRLNSDDVLPPWWQGTMLGAWAVAGITLPLAVPALSRGLVHGLGSQSRWVSGRLAARRLAVEPASAARPLAGLATATYSSMLLLVFLAAITDGSGQFQRQRSYLENGPQPITVVPPEAAAPGAAAEPVGTLTARDIADVPGVLHVTPTYRVHVDHPAGDIESCQTIDGCLTVLVGSCTDLAQFQVITGCTDGAVQIVEPNSDDPWWWLEELPTEITLVGPGGELTLPVATDKVSVDLDATRARFYGFPRGEGLIVPPDLPGVAEVIGEPTGYLVTATGGTDIREDLADVAATHGMRAWPEPVETYEKTMLARAGLLALLAAVVTIGFITAGVGMVDRAIERRRAVAALAVIGTPVRTLRLSQAIQVLVPLLVAVTAALVAGLLATQTFRNTEILQGNILVTELELGTQLGSLAGPLALGCLAIVLATLPGTGARLRPESLRRD